MLTSYSDNNTEQDLQEEETSIALIDENDFCSLAYLKYRGNRGFGRGHIVRQYMSGVGVITEKYVSDDNLLFYDSTGRSLDNYSTSNSAENSHEYLTEDEEVKEEIIIPENCPCYEKAFKDEMKKRGFFNNIFTLILNLKSRIYKILFK